MVAKSIVTASVIGMMLCGVACKHKPQYAAENSNAYGNFPDAVGKIIISKCATSGCHNAASYTASAGLLLDSWEHLFDGSVSGAVVVPYNIENSSLLFFINTDSSLGLRAQPLMPLNGTPLSREEFITIRDWIASGAPAKDGTIPFSSNAATRQKVYMVNQGCDLVSVVDAEKRVTMRYIKVGVTPSTEAPHYIKVAPDGYAYVSFTAGTVIQKIDTRTDQVVGSIEIGQGGWNAFNVSDDGKKLLLTDFTGNRMILINTQAMNVEMKFGGLPLYSPHGIASNATFDTFRITSQYGNTVYRFETNKYSLEANSIDGAVAGRAARRNPHEILMNPDRSKYFLTCDASNEVRVMDTKTDKVIDSIAVGVYPQTMAISKTKPYLFVTCSEDISSLSGFRGSVYVINYETHAIVQRIDGPFYQPHGIIVDDQNGVFYIANRNVLSTGPAPHHSSSCGGRNGYYLAYDLNTLQKLPKRYEVSVDPYAIDIRFE